MSSDLSENYLNLFEPIDLSKYSHERVEHFRISLYKNFVKNGLENKDVLKKLVDDCLMSKSHTDIWEFLLFWLDRDITSRVSEIYMDLKRKKNIEDYAVNFNILRIHSGMGGLAYSSQLF